MLSFAPWCGKAVTLAAAVLIALCVSSMHVAAVSVRVDFIIMHYMRSDDPLCEAGLDWSGGITLEVYYRTASNASVLPGVCNADNWRHQETINSPALSNTPTNVSLPPNMTTPFQLRVLQLDHAGGDCNNWKLSDVRVILDDSVIPITCISCFICTASKQSSINHSTAVFYSESASMPRGLLTHWLDPAAETVKDLIIRNENCTGPQCLLPCDTEQDVMCSDAAQEAHIELSFLLHWSYNSSSCNCCDAPNANVEGIELSIRQINEPIWRPLAYFTGEGLLPGPDYLKLGYNEGNNLYLRGYLVPRVDYNSTDKQHNISIRVCDPRYLNNASVQFRWLQTSRVNSEYKDIWSLDDVKVDAVREGGESRETLYWQHFENFTANQSLDWRGARRAHVLEDSQVCNCERDGKALSFFNGRRIHQNSAYIQSRSFRIHTISVKLEPDHQIIQSAELRKIYSQIQVDATGGLRSLLFYLQDRRSEVNEMEVVALLLATLDAIGNSTVSSQFSQGFFNVSSQLMAIVSSRNTTENPNSLAGSTLLSLNDDFALNNHNTTVDTISNANLGFIVTERTKEEKKMEVEVSFDTEGFSISMPEELYSREQENIEEALFSSFLYGNMSGFLDNALPKPVSSGSRLAGPVLSSRLHCPSRQCDTARKLENNKTVKLVFPNVTVSNDTEPVCVFWEFGKRQNDSFIPGEWSTEGCVTRVTGQSITCECTHLTHFAILLSPGIETSDEVSLSLTIIGIIGVSISLVALAATVFTFIAFRSLWGMRNYVHVQLCVSLALAQLVFVAAVEPRGNEDVCSAVAVLLHYLFLVSFMWMLMEGVVLYVALVRVFVENHIRYSIAFTIASYGLPLLYMAVCVPLGFALRGSDGESHYGNDKACWLRYDTHFVWAFIAPVILIIMINIGFFVMAIAIMCRHQQRQTHQSNSEKVRHWLKASISLTVVMGITWVMGVLVFTEALLFVAYIFTIFVAFQGLIIFILLVVLSQQVRETYGKWWKVKVANSEFLSKHLSEDGIGITFLTRLKNSRSGTTSPTMDKSGVESRNSNIYVNTKTAHSQDDTIL